MNVPGFIISGLIFILALRISYEIWFEPDKYIARVNYERGITRIILGFSFWKENRINMPLVKIASIMILVGSLLAIIASITGPITY